MVCYHISMSVNITPSSWIDHEGALLAHLAVGGSVTDWVDPQDEGSFKVTVVSKATITGARVSAGLAAGLVTSLKKERAPRDSRKRKRLQSSRRITPKIPLTARMKQLISLVPLVPNGCSHYFSDGERIRVVPSLNFEFKCSCKEWGKVEDFIYHMNMQHGISPSFPCPHPGCSFSGTTPSGTERHFQWDHSEEKKFHCGHCDFAETAARKVREHISKHLPSEYQANCYPSCNVRLCDGEFYYTIENSVFN
ncbi:MAG: hypothetical protein SP1CHLAM42_04570 [Chlamydiales bacterium]|nr:hypothetical protein [Chlamydiales bacterium]